MGPLEYSLCGLLLAVFLKTSSSSVPLGQGSELCIFTNIQMLQAMNPYLQYSLVAELSFQTDPLLLRHFTQTL